MENPFELLMNKLSSIEKRLESIEECLEIRKELQGVETAIEPTTKHLNLMDIDELCYAYDLKKSFVYSKTRTKELECHKWDGRLVFDTCIVEEYLKKYDSKYEHWEQKKLPKRGRYETDIVLDENEVDEFLLRTVFNVKIE